MMKLFRFSVMASMIISAALVSSMAYAAQYTRTIEIFKQSPAVKPFFDNCHGYAVFPTVAKGGLMYEATVGGQKFSFKPNK